MSIAQVEPSSAAAEKGLRSGDVILEIAGQNVNRPRDVADGLRKAKQSGRKAVLLRVLSGGQQRFVALPIKSS